MRARDNYTSQLYTLQINTYILQIKCPGLLYYTHYTHVYSVYNMIIIIIIIKLPLTNLERIYTTPLALHITHSIALCTSLGSRPSPYVRVLIARGWENRCSVKIEQYMNCNMLNISTCCLQIRTVK